MAIPIKALQAQDPCASQPQETIIETLKKKKRLTKEKSKQTAHAPGHVTDNHEQKQCRPDKHLPRRSVEENNTTTYNPTEKPDA